MAKGLRRQVNTFDFLKTAPKNLNRGRGDEGRCLSVKSRKCPSANKRTISPQKGLFRNGVGSQNGGLAMRGANYDNARCSLHHRTVNANLLSYSETACLVGLNTNISTELT